MRNQGWIDSRQAICYPDGRVVEPPIALAEVQGYVYDARKRMARYFRWLGDGERADDLDRQAETLKARFKRDFWLESRDFWALALDAEKRPVAAISSNPGHCVWSGLLDGADGRLAARRLLQDDMSCGWGVRTLSSAETAFNPMSYHNGSVWPHDTSLIAAGFKRLGLDRDATQLISDVFEAAVRFPGGRLPELYCGFTRDRRYFSMPAQYPVSCSPQAWAAGSVFLMLQSMLGLRVDAAKGRVWLRPRLVDWVQRVSVRRLRVADHRLDFELRREGDRTRVEVWDSGGLELVVEPVAEPR
jgi:glycogen debranching enzyme